MYLQPEFYLHILFRAGDAAPLMARLALHLAHDATLYPIDLNDLKKLKHFSPPGETCRLNLFFVSDFLRAVTMEGVRNWTEHEVGRLKTFADAPIPEVIPNLSQIKEKFDS